MILAPYWKISAKSSKVQIAATVPLRFIVLFLLTGFLWSPATATSVTPAPRVGAAGGSGGADCTMRPIMLLERSRRDRTHSCCRTRSKVNRRVMSGSRMWRTIDFALADIWSLTLDLEFKIKWFTKE